jgi:hypothetical protein
MLTAMLLALSTSCPAYDFTKLTTAQALIAEGRRAWSANQPGRAWAAMSRCAEAFPQEAACHLELGLFALKWMYEQSLGAYHLSKFLELSPQHKQAAQARAFLANFTKDGQPVPTQEADAWGTYVPSAAHTTGCLEPTAVAAALAPRAEALQACKAFVKSLPSRGSISFDVDPLGNSGSSETWLEHHNPKLYECVTSAFAGVSFPKPSNGKVVVRHRFTLR